MKKLLALVLATMLMLSVASSAFACASIYVGSALTATGTTLFARSEDMANSVCKLFNVVPAGRHAGGEVYLGCAEFAFTFTHDTYGYNAFPDNYLSGVCPDCDEEYFHTPFEEAGTNDQGLTVSATETLSGKKEVRSVDPFAEGGVGFDEADMVTILLGECATAREAMELTCKLYDEVGATGSNGFVMADQDEIWYIENCSGTQYIAIKLPDTLMFLNPNMSVIGLIDLDDTENVVASKDLIAVAKAAGTYVGDEEANTIDFRASYSSLSINERMINGLNYVNSANAFTADNVTDADFTITNVDAEGNIITLSSAIVADRAFDVSDMVGYFRVAPIGRVNNQEIHIYDIDANNENMELATVEWAAMNDGRYTVYVPYYPMMTTEIYDAYMYYCDTAYFAEEVPEGGFGYPATQNVRDAEGNRVTVQGYKVLPEGWENNVYWTVNALSNYTQFVNPDVNDYVLEQLDLLQDKVYEGYGDMLLDIEEGTATAETLTNASNAIAAYVHQAIYDLYLEVSAK